MKKNYIFFILLISTSHLAISQTWGTFGDGANKQVYAMQEYNNGLIIGGKFDTINSTKITCLAYYKYNGSSYYWSTELSNDYKTSATSTVSSAYIDAIEIFDNKIHIGGYFFHPFYFDALNIGYLTNSGTWSLSPYYAHASQTVTALKAFNDTLFIGGGFTNFVGTNYIAYIKSQSYPSPFPYTPGDGLNSNVNCFEIFNGELYAGGYFTSNGNSSTTLNRVAKWNGTEWIAVGEGFNGSVSSLTTHNNELIAGGSFTLSGTTSVKHIAKWNGTSWSPLGDGFSNSSSCDVKALLSYNNILYAGGSFNSSGTINVLNIAKWNGTSWSSIGDGVNGTVRCLGFADDKLFVGGDFTTAGGITANYIAYCSGLQALPNIINSEIFLNVIPNPAKEIITVETSKNSKESVLTIYNINGQKMLYRQINSTKTQIDISTFNSGVYFVKLFSNNKTKIIKLVKE